MTPYWSICNSASKDISLDQIVISDTGGGAYSGTEPNLQLSQFFEAHYFMGDKKELGSVRKKLVFTSNEFRSGMVGFM
jgi:hypothetical protein